MLSKSHRLFQNSVVIKMRASNSKRYRGYRSQIYRIAACNCARYTSTESIVYAENYLSINLFFKVEENGYKCLNEIMVLTDISFSGIVLSYEHLPVSPLEYEILSQNKVVLYTDYKLLDKASFYDSPEVSSVASSQVVFYEVENLHLPHVKMRLLEKLTLREFSSIGVTSAHIVPSASKNQPIDKNCSDNFIYCSWTFHSWFEGLHSKDALGIAHFPSILLTYVSHDDELFPNGNEVIQTSKVTIKIQCRNVDIFYHLEEILKDGSEKDIDNRMWYTYMNVENVEVFKKALKEKERLTLEKWNKTPALCPLYYQDSNT